MPPQLNLPIFAPLIRITEPQAVPAQLEARPLESVKAVIPTPEPLSLIPEPERAAEPPPETEAGHSWQKLHDELEGLYLHLQESMAYGPEFARAWAKARAATCEAYGTTVAAFYAELENKSSRRGR